MKNVIPSMSKMKGTVVKLDLQNTATIEMNSQRYVPKYQRYFPVTTRVKAHNPNEVNAVIGDIVEINFCRPLSKTKHFVITKKVSKDVLFKLKQESKEEAKIKSKRKTEEKEIKK